MLITPDHLCVINLELNLERGSGRVPRMAIEHLMDIGRCSYDTAKDAYKQHGRNITKACDALIGGAESD